MTAPTRKVLVDRLADQKAIERTLRTGAVDVDTAATAHARIGGEVEELAASLARWRRIGAFAAAARREQQRRRRELAQGGGEPA